MVILVGSNLPLESRHPEKISILFFKKPSSTLDGSITQLIMYLLSPRETAVFRRSPLRSLVGGITFGLSESWNYCYYYSPI